MVGVFSPQSKATEPLWLEVCSCVHSKHSSSNIWCSFVLKRNIMTLQAFWQRDGYFLWFSLLCRCYFLVLHLLAPHENKPSADATSTQNSLLLPLTGNKCWTVFQDHVPQTKRACVFMLPAMSPTSSMRSHPEKASPRLSSWATVDCLLLLVIWRETEKKRLKRCFTLFSVLHYIICGTENTQAQMLLSVET